MRYTTETFINAAKKVHGEKFDYSKVEYKKFDEKVCIICPIHGEFWQTPHSHLNGTGCPKCYGHYKPTTEEFISRLKIIHGDKYDYSLVKYISTFNKVKLICPIHGEFEITPNRLVSGQGCRKCGNKSAQAKNRMRQAEFLERAKEVHNEKYDYSKAEYTNTDTKVCIICPEHGEFWQTPHHHLNGIGCPICGRNDVSENKLYEEIKKEFPDAIHTYRPDFLYNNGKPQSLDIFIPSLNVAIEYQGRQHFIPISKYGGKKEFENTKRRDKQKFELCQENKVKLYYISYEKEAPIFYFSTIYRNKEDLISVIKNG